MECTHLDSVKTDQPRTQGCEECLKTGDTWVHLVDEIAMELGA